MNSKLAYVIDTHPLIWYLAGSPKLKPAARRALTRIERGDAVGLIPVIVLAELIYLFEKRRTTVSLKQVLTEIDRIPSYQIISLDRAQIEEVAKLTGISEMHDRMIVAVTRLRGAKLITKDQEIKDSGLVDVVWA
jgi:predicted nucleic acid-binding protein